MSRKIFSNANILVGEELEIIKGFLEIQNNKIKKIGEGEPPEEGIDLNNGFVIPTFVNAHTHLADSVKKDIYIGKKQPEVVGAEGKKFEALESSTREEKINAIKSSMNDMTRTGTSAHCDFREFGIEGIRLIKEAIDPSLKTIILSRPNNQEKLSELLEASNGIGLSSIESLSKDSLRKVSSEIQKTGKLLSVHVAETKDAQENSMNETGKTEIQRALDLNPSFLVHGTWASARDLNSLSENGVPLVICGRANHLLSVGSPPVSQAIERGVEIWLGTDNATVCQPDMFSELSFVWALIRRDNPQAGSNEARTLLKASTINPAKGLNLSFGVLEEGKKASFIVLNRQENLTQLKDPYVGIVGRARTDNIRMIHYPNGELRKFYK